MGVSRNLNRKRARGGKLQDRHGALFEDCDDEDIVVQKRAEQELNSNTRNPKGALNKHNVALKSRQILKQPNSKSSKKRQDRKPNCSKNGQQFNSKSSKKTQDLNSESDRSTQGHKLPDVKGKLCDAEGTGLDTLKMSIDVKGKKKKKIKKKRDRLGQVLDDRGDMHGAVPDHVDDPRNAACAGVGEGLHTIANDDKAAIVLEPFEAPKGPNFKAFALHKQAPFTSKPQDVLTP